MEFLAQIPVIGTPLITILSFVATLAIVVFVHEFGHYIVGRWCGIHAETFSLGFGPVLASRVDRHGTRWQVAALPLGGYVKFLGDADGSSRVDPAALDALPPEDRNRAFHTAQLWRRALTVVAGPAANFLLTAAILAGLSVAVGDAKEPPTVEAVRTAELAEVFQPGDVVVGINEVEVATYRDLLTEIGTAEDPVFRYRLQRDGQEVAVEGPTLSPPLVSAVAPLSPAAAAGVEEGDLILSINGTALSRFADLPALVTEAQDQTVPMTVLRDGEELTLEITPRLQDIDAPGGGFEKRVLIGVVAAMGFEPAYEVEGPIGALWDGISGTGQLISRSLSSIYALVTGEIALDNLSGPVGISQVSAHQAQSGWLDFIQFVAMISTAIGLINLFPIPVLDGGHLAFFGYEAVAGRPPPEAALRIAMSVGLSLVLLLMLFATYNDIVRLL